MNLKQSGFLLPMTMLMLATMTLLTLSSMQSIFNDLKLIQHMKMKHENFHELEMTSLVLAQSAIYSQKDECKMNFMDPNEIIHRLQIHQGCSYVNQHRKYEYLINDLGIYPCLKIQLNQAQYSSHHWLITVISLSDSTLLQLRVAQAGNILNCHGKVEQTIHPGVMSWRLYN